MLPKYSKLLFVYEHFDQASDRVKALTRFMLEQGKIQVTMQNTQRQYNLKQFRLVLLTD